MKKEEITMIYVGEPSYIMDLYIADYKKVGVKAIYSGGLEGIRKILEQQHVDIILININNTYMNVLHFIKSLKKLVGSETPIVATGVISLEGEEKKYLEGGASAFIEEPLSKEDSLEKIKKILHLSVRSLTRLSTHYKPIGIKS